MRPKDLFIEAARHVQPDAHGVTTPETLRLDELRRALKERAANIIDRVFAVHGQAKPLSESGYIELHIPGVVDHHNDVIWNGDVKISRTHVGIESSKEEKEVTRRQITLETKAEEEFDKLAPEGYHVRRLILIGAHDVRHSFDGGVTWKAIYRTSSLDVFTGLYIHPNDESGQSDLDDGLVVDPFESGPFFLERLNDHYPVFNEGDYATTLMYPGDLTPHAYPNPQSLIEGLHASLDDFERALS